MIKRSLLISWMILLLLGGFLWWGFAPVQIGGPVGYVIVNGSSMEPGFSKGDLVLTRSEIQPQPGTAVVYQQPQIGMIFHRVIDIQNGSYLLQGDNNDWVDSYQPAEDEIIGGYWLRIPSGGTIITRLREPLNFSLLSLGIVGVIISLFYFQKQDMAKKRKNRVKNPAHASEKKSDTRAGEFRQDLLLMLGVLALAAVILGLFAFLQPLEQEVSEEFQYQHQSELNYSAQDLSGIYDSSQVMTGQPVYLDLTCRVDLNIDYRLTAPAMTPGNQALFTGSYRISALLEDVDGWQRTIPLEDFRSFSGTSFSEAAELDVCEIRDLILEKEQKTGTSNRWYTLFIRPEINYQGQISELPLEGVFRPEFQFQIDTSLMRLPGEEEQLTIIEEGALEKTRILPNTLSIFGLSLEVKTARWTALSVLIICLAGGIWPLVSLYRDWKSSDASWIQVQYHPMLVDVAFGSPARNAEQIVQVASFQDLSKMAERYGAMILHESRGHLHRYSIQDEGTVYQYSLDGIRDHSLFSDLNDFKIALNTALEEDQFELYYQPIVDLRSKQVTGIEAFVRWNHPRLGLLYPAEFIQLAEENGLIPVIDRWVIESGCRQLNEWGEFGLPLVPLSINISPNTILDDNFSNHIENAVVQSSCNPDFLQLEINRSNQVFRDKTIQQRLLDLRRLGVRLALDNFATDAANQIDQVSRMPIQSLKIDRSIMQGITGDQSNLRLINAVVKMARSLQIEVIAQGVENNEQIALLEKQEISLAQGYFLGDPVPAREMGWKLGKTLPQGSGKELEE